MRRRLQSAALAAAFVVGSAVPLAAQHGTTAHAPKTAATAPASSLPPREKPREDSPQDVADRIMKAIRDHAEATASPRRAVTPPRAQRYRLEWPPHRYKVVWPQDDDRVSLEWPEMR